MAGGKYLQQKPPKKSGRRNAETNMSMDNGNYRQVPNAKTKKSSGKKILLIVLVAVLLLIIGIAVAGIIYYNSVLSMVSRPEDITVPTLSEEEINELLGLNVTEEATTEGTTSPMETWPEIVSDQNITNIMVVGQAARIGEEHRLADSNILVSINRETKTVTLTSILRDLRVNIPAYEGHGAGFNRINVVYHLGSYYTGEKIDSMKMMEMCIENNFGVKVDYTIEVDFELFTTIVDLFGGMMLTLNQDELNYMITYYSYYEPIQDLVVGENWVDGFTALCYARMRKVGNGDWDRTSRQREVITQLFNRAKNNNIITLNNCLKYVLPMITTDMSNEEITNLAFEILPMLKDMKINAQTIPFEGTWWGTDLDPNGVHNYVIDANLWNNGKMLRESIGYDTVE